MIKAGDLGMIKTWLSLFLERHPELSTTEGVCVCVCVCVGGGWVIFHTSSTHLTPSQPCKVVSR